jgi:hypothetical protein
MSASLPKGHTASEETRQNAVGSTMQVHKQNQLRRTSDMFATEPQRNPALIAKTHPHARTVSA